MYRETSADEVTVLWAERPANPASIPGRDKCFPSSSAQRRSQRATQLPIQWVRPFFDRE
jgi:hypothetical protein